MTGRIKNSLNNISVGRTNRWVYVTSGPAQSEGESRPLEVPTKTNAGFSYISAYLPGEQQLAPDLPDICQLMSAQILRHAFWNCQDFSSEPITIAENAPSAIEAMQHELSPEPLRPARRFAETDRQK
jgi:hypothetical protein